MYLHNSLVPWWLLYLTVYMLVGLDEKPDGFMSKPSRGVETVVQPKNVQFCTLSEKH